MDIESLEKELRGRLTITRLAKTGFFRKAKNIPEEARKEIKLFRAILDKALVDAVSPKPNLRDDAVNWFNLNDKDFLFICECAYLEPTKVIAGYEAIKRILRK